MDKALAEKQFRIVYQPKYSVVGNKPKLTSAEALTRWYHPEFGIVSPKDYISLFETNGLIHKLDRYVWNEAASQIKKWKEKFGVCVPVSVNVSRIDIFDPKLSRTLSDITSENGLENDKLLLEITESAYTEDLLQVVNTVDGLRSQGFKIEMDDFGSGYSSLNMLTSLPIDALKLDMEFIRNICESKKNCRLVSIMIDIARLLKVPVIAEGVETRGQMELLKEVGCDIIQGYYFSKPLGPEEFEELISAEYAEGTHAYS
ncbi:EAL domain-containing protein [Ruminococcus sp. HUN007]|uniref:EAL domain-containing protein n=1 Tax=Ruminococcus sp. HUN007 TaxID=1514668 RepID=UPI0006785A1C|nr:EAL domain-containing protein [Ruminococcus sp. HUN007]